MISIVIVNWNSGGLLENCVRSLLRNAAGCQIIVVDNASTDSSLLFFEQMQDGPVLIRNSRTSDLQPEAIWDGARAKVPFFSF